MIGQCSKKFLNLNKALVYQENQKSFQHIESCDTYMKH